MVEVVQADDALGLRGRGRELGHGVGRGVGREDRVGPADLVEAAEHVLLDREVLEHRLDDQVDAREILESRRPGDALAESRRSSAAVKMPRCDAFSERLARWCSSRARPSRRRGRPASR